MRMLPEQFIVDTPPRIIGSECEFELQGKLLPGQLTSVARKSLQQLDIRYVGNFLSNGGKMYAETGNHLEYASPECLGPREAAAADLAGNIIIRKVVETSGTKHNGLYRRSGTYIPEENARQSGYTKGYHENFLIPQALAADPLLTETVAGMLATRVYAMAGAVHQTGYILSQKQEGIGYKNIVARSEVARTAHGGKPMIMIQDADEEIDIFGADARPQWSRMEVRFADACLSPNANLLGKAAVSLALRLVEHQDIFGKRLHGMYLKDVHSAASVVSTDLTMKTPIETASQRITALDLQEKFLDMSLELSELFELPEDELDAIDLWAEILEGLRNSNPLEADYDPILLSHLDFAAKHAFITRALDSTDISNANPDAVQLDMAWDAILPRGAGTRWWHKKKNDQLIHSEEIIDLVSYPPEGTRARIRGDYIYEHPNRSNCTATWSSVNGAGRPKPYEFNDLYVIPAPSKRLR